MEISLSLEGGKLIGRATGQPSFPLTYEGDYLFSFSPASLTLQFSPDSDKMLLKQGGMTFEFKKK
ncbi:hypothetical protein GCM10008106_28730 [Mongoliitalea lutea]|uniref:Uncharacterized protein n=1 Tax=Mongoliitalea lutea TaxID=849756 RepID=A0A8J3CXV2_9BACT|nr:hypothetical protein GCM10008106_28730 [Mongoliitalea lutea]